MLTAPLRYLPFPVKGRHRQVRVVTSIPGLSNSRTHASQIGDTGGGQMQRPESECPNENKLLCVTKSKAICPLTSGFSVCGPLKAADRGRQRGPDGSGPQLRGLSTPEIHLCWRRYKIDHLSGLIPEID
jgi:hypothetical protein